MTFELGTTESERAAQTFAICSLLGFFTYCAFKLLVYSAIRQHDTDIYIFELKQQLRVLTEKLQNTSETLTTQQEDSQQDLRILQERLDKFGEGLELLYSGLLTEEGYRQDGVGYASLNKFYTENLD